MVCQVFFNQCYLLNNNVVNHIRKKYTASGVAIFTASRGNWIMYCPLSENMTTMVNKRAGSIGLIFGINLVRYYTFYLLKGTNNKDVFDFFTTAWAMPPIKTSSIQPLPCVPIITRLYLLLFISLISACFGCPVSSLAATSFTPLPSTVCFKISSLCLSMRLNSVNL